LLDQRDGNKRGRIPQQLGGCAPTQRRIDKGPHDLRVDDLQADAAQQQQYQPYKQGFLRRNVPGKQIPVGS